MSPSELDLETKRIKAEIAKRLASQKRFKLTSIYDDDDINDSMSKLDRASSSMNRKRD